MMANSGHQHLLMDTRKANGTSPKAHEQRASTFLDEVNRHNSKNFDLLNRESEGVSTFQRNDELSQMQSMGRTQKEDSKNEQIDSVFNPYAVEVTEETVDEAWIARESKLNQYRLLALLIETSIKAFPKSV
jgi:hypothetical protein